MTDDTGAIGRDFEGATASAGTGLWIEVVSGVLALGAGALALLIPRLPNQPRDGRSRAEEAAARKRRRPEPPPAPTAED